MEPTSGELSGSHSLSIVNTELGLPRDDKGTLGLLISWVLFKFLILECGGGGGNSTAMSRHKGKMSCLTVYIQ